MGTVLARFRGLSAMTKDAVLGSLLSVGALAQSAWSPGALVLTVVLATGFAWRRSVPLVTAFALALANVMGERLDPRGDDAPVAAIVMIILICYSIAAYERDLLRSLLGMAVVSVGVNWDLIVQGLPTDEFWPFRLVFLFAAWAAGRNLLARRREVEQATARAELLSLDKESATRDAVADERARIGRELHDVIAHNVSVMVVQAGAADQVLSDRPESAREPLRSIQTLGRQTIVELRRLLGILKAGDRELETAPQPSLRHLDPLVMRVRDAGLPVEVRLQGDCAGVPASIDLSAFRVVQEALTNVLKHAGETSAVVQVRYGRADLEVLIEDGGRGPDSNRNPGFGLLGIRERVNLFGGSLEAGPRPEGGFRVRAVFPLEEAGR